VRPELQSRKERLIYNLLVPKLLKRKDKIIADSYCTKNDLVNCLKISEDKIDVIHLGVDEKYRVLNQNETLSIMRQYGIEHPFILYVGTLNYRKNLPLLLRSFYRIMKKLPGYKLLCIGKMGWNSQPIIDLIRQLNLINDVKIMGYLPDAHLPYFYNASDLFVFPSLYEGFGLPPLEAMACGTPVITSNTSSLPEVVGDAAIMVDPCDDVELSNSIQQCLTNDELTASLVEKGINRAKLFDWKITAKNTIKLYERL
jgi:glycosyltransferase involved in cell wall biosynthesis